MSRIIHAHEYLTGRKNASVLAAIGMLHDADTVGFLAPLKAVDDWLARHQKV